jgi:hypothetical protein
MNKDEAASLRLPFAPNQIGTVPKGGDRLLQVDPEWTWAPVAHDERGLPRLDEHGGLWISLTVCGVTRYGYGDAAGKKGPNAVKEAIGDAIRNAAMRFGVALDLWAKEDLQASRSGDEPGGGPPPGRSPQRASTRPDPSTPTGKDPETERAFAQRGTVDLKLPPERRDIISDAQKTRLWTIARSKSPNTLALSDPAVHNIVTALTGQKHTSHIRKADYDAVIKEIREQKKPS